MEDETKLCRCCLAQGLHKDLNSTYNWLDQNENYATMLQDCYNIVLSSSPQIGNGICDECVKALRAAYSFKQTVLRSEKELMSNMFSQIDLKSVAVKLEPKHDGDGDDSDDYSLADAVREVQLSRVKVESPPAAVSDDTGLQKRSGRRGCRRPAAAGDCASDVGRLLTRLNSIQNNQLTIRKKNEKRAPKALKCLDIKPRDMIISPDAFKKPRIDLVWSSRVKLDKAKHRDNLITVLKYSNVVPFKDKSLLGYICGYCDATWPDPTDLRAHTETQHAKERLDFKSNFDMTDFSVKVDITDLTCTLCEENFDNLSDHKQHLVKVHDKIIHNDIKDHMVQFKLRKGDVFDCAMCSATYETFKMLKQHMNKHYCNYTCSKCDSTFATKRSLNSHRTTHLEGSFKCDHCDKVFASKAKKQYHEKSKHMGTRNISNCPYCNEPFRSYYQRNQHLIKVHNTEAQYKCNVCSKSYILKSLLMYHIKKCHLMERNCQCSECGYRFFSKKALKAHMVKHTGERNFTCHVCHKAYARKYTLREHLRIHSNDRRFRCDVCAMTFVQKCSLKSHLLSNHGISMAASDITCVDAGDDESDSLK